MDAISALPKGGGMNAASCAALGLSRASLHRRPRLAPCVTAAREEIRTRARRQ